MTWTTVAVIGIGFDQPYIRRKRMEIRGQVTSLDLSKKLKEAGYLQEGFWWWHCHEFNDNDFIVLGLKRENRNYVKVCVAPTCAELLYSFRSNNDLTQDEISLCWVGGVIHHWETRIMGKTDSGATSQEALGNLWLKK